MELFIGNTLNLNGQNFQNWSLQEANFLPFGFSGAVINRNGDNVTAALVFPNTSISRSWASSAVTLRWIAYVSVYQLNINRLMYSYVGQVSAASWDTQTVRLELSSVLDAVGSDIPFRSLSEDLVGPIPTSSNVRVL